MVLHGRRPFISSDPNALPRSYWADLHRQRRSSPNLAPELQAEALAEATEADHPAKAAEIREWNPPTRPAMVARLDVAKAGNCAKTTELWTSRKVEREVRRDAVYTIVELDLRLLEGGGIVQTQLCRDAPTLRKFVDRWSKAFTHAGWTEVVRQSITELTSDI